MKRHCRSASYPHLPRFRFTLAQLDVPWRPLHRVLQSTQLSDVNPRSRSGQARAAAHRAELLALLKAAKDHYDPTSASEVFNAFAPSLECTTLRPLPTLSLVFLHHFLPSRAGVQHLPDGTASLAGLLRLWSAHDLNVAEGNIYASIVSNLLQHTLCLDSARGVVPLPPTTVRVVLHKAFKSCGLKGSSAAYALGGHIDASVSHVMHGVDFPPELLACLHRHPLVVLGDEGDVTPDTVLSPSEADAMDATVSEGKACLATVKGGADALGGMERFLRSVETVLHPNNSMSAGKLPQLLEGWLFAIAQRAGREAGAREAAAALAKTGAGSTPEACLAASGAQVLAPEHHLTPLDLHRVVSLAMPLLRWMAFSSSTVQAAAARMAWQHLASLAPRRVTAEVVRLVSESLDPQAGSAATTVHRRPAALLLLGDVARPLLWPRPWLAPHLPSLMGLVLGTLQAAEERHMVTSLQVLTRLLGLMPPVDPSDTSEWTGSLPAGVVPRFAIPPGAVPGESATMELVANGLPSNHPDKAALQALARGSAPDTTAALQALQASITELHTTSGNISAHSATALPVPVAFDELRLPSPVGIVGSISGTPAEGVLPLSSVAPPAAWSSTLCGVPLPAAGADVLLQLYQATHTAAGSLPHLLLAALPQLLKLVERAEVASGKGSRGGAGGRISQLLALLGTRTMSSLSMPGRHGGEKPSRLVGGPAHAAWGLWKGSSASRIGQVLDSLFRGLFATCGPSTRKAAFDQLEGWVAGLSPATKCSKYAARALAAAVSSAPAQGCAAFLPLLLERASAAASKASAKALALTLAAGVVRAAQDDLLPWLPKVQAAVLAAFGDEDSDVFEAGLRLLRHALVTMTSIAVRGGDVARSLPLEEWRTGFLWLRWGELEWATHSCHVEWFCPSDECRSASLALLTATLLPALHYVREALPEPAQSALQSAPPHVTGALDQAAGAASASDLAAVLSEGASKLVQGPAAKSESIRRAVQVCVAGFRGALPWMTDGTTKEGDDGVVAHGTGHTGDHPVPGLRQAIAWVAHGLLGACLGGSTFAGTSNSARDAALITAVQELVQRVVSQRGVRKGKCHSWGFMLQSSIAKDALPCLLSARRAQQQLLLWHSNGGQEPTLCSSVPESHTRLWRGCLSRQMACSRAQVQHGNRTGVAIQAVLAALHCCTLLPSETSVRPLQLQLDDQDSEADPSAAVPHLPLPLSAGGLCDPQQVLSSLGGLTVLPAGVQDSTPSRGKAVASGEAVYASIALLLLYAGSHAYESVVVGATQSSFPVMSTMPWMRGGVSALAEALANSSISALMELPEAPGKAALSDEGDSEVESRRRLLWLHFRAAFLPNALPRTLASKAAWSGAARFHLAQLLLFTESAIQRLPSDTFSEALGLVTMTFRQTLMDWAASAAPKPDKHLVKLSDLLLAKLAVPEPGVSHDLAGEKVPSAAPVGEDQAVHWRFRLLASSLLAMTWTPAASLPAEFAASGPGTVANLVSEGEGFVLPPSVAASGPARTAVSLQDWCPPDAVWCWWAAACLSDSVPLRTLAQRVLGNLLHALVRGAPPGEGTRAGAVEAAVSPGDLQAVLAARAPEFLRCLGTPAYLEQLLAAKVDNRGETQGRASAGPANAMAGSQWSAGVEEMGSTVDPAHAQVGGNLMCHGGFQAAHAHFWSAVYRVLGSAALDALQPALTALTSTAADHPDASKRAAAAVEVWAGVSAACVDAEGGPNTILGSGASDSLEFLFGDVASGEAGAWTEAPFTSAKAVQAVTGQAQSCESAQAAALCAIAPLLDSAGLERLPMLQSGVSFIAHSASPAQCAPILALLVSKVVQCFVGTGDASDRCKAESFGASSKWLSLLTMALEEHTHTLSVGAMLLPAQVAPGEAVPMIVRAPHHYLPGSLSGLARHSTPGACLPLSAWADSAGAAGVGGALSGRAQAFWICRRLLATLCDVLVHPFQATRTALAGTFGILLAAACAPSDAGAAAGDPGLGWGHLPLSVGWQGWGPAVLSRVLAVLSTAADGGEEACERAMEFCAHLLRQAFTFSSASNPPVVLPFLPLLLRKQQFGSEDVGTTVKLATRFVGTHLAPVAAHPLGGHCHTLQPTASTPLAYVTSVLAAAAQDESWRSRRAAVELASALRVSLGLALPQDVDNALQEVILKRLGDRQHEVQVAAGDAAGVLASSLSTGDSRALLRRMAPHVLAKVPPRPPAAAPQADKARFAKAVRRRLAGVLGTAAVVVCHPYTVPPYVPDALSLLGRCATDGAPVGKAVQKVVTSFRATHADEWETLHRFAFTPEQLDEVRDMLVSPHYFA